MRAARPEGPVCQGSARRPGELYRYRQRLRTSRVSGGSTVHIGKQRRAVRRSHSACVGTGSDARNDDQLRSHMIDIEAEGWLGRLLPHVVDLARQAGKSIMTVYNEVDPAIEYKPDGSPLTQADLASHRVIVNGLARLSPDWPVLCEEAAHAPFDLRKSWRHFWMVDPLDG